MTDFVLAGLALALLTLALLTRPLWLRRRGDVEPTAAAAIAALRRQMDALVGALAAGTLDTARYQAERAALEQRIVDAVVAAPTDPASGARPSAPLGLLAGLVVVVAGVGVVGYALVGTPAALAPRQIAASSLDSPAAADASAITPEQIEQMIERLALRLKDRPDDVEGWSILGRSYAVLGKHEQAASAFKQALGLLPNDAMLMTHYADSLAVVNRGFDGEPNRLIARALAVDPSNLKALSLAGSMAFERKDYALALRHWEKMAALAPTSEFRQQIQGGIDEARKLMGGQGAAPVLAATDPTASAAVAGVAGSVRTADSTPSSAGAQIAAKSITGVVTLAPALVARVQPGDTLFVFARASEDPRMPLAILRKQVRDLPLSFTLDDSTAMAPELRLSGANRVVVGARISRTGQAIPAVGDLQGSSAAVAPGAVDLKIEISEVVGP